MSEEKAVKNENLITEKSTLKKVETEEHLSTVTEVWGNKSEYKNVLAKLQIELVKMQRWIQDTDNRVVIIFEGRDASGKGGAIKRFTEYLNPRAMRVVALPKPTEIEKGQWYFQRYVNELPNPGQIVFFDRSWYNRAVVEPVNGFCTAKQYKQFMRQVPEFEHMLYEDGILLIKFWYSVSKEIQLGRFDERKGNPLKNWKHSSVDAKAQELFEEYGKYKNRMFSKTHTTFSPWIIVKGDEKRAARIESIRYVLNQIDYDGKDNANVGLLPDPNIIMRYHRGIDS